MKKLILLLVVVNIFALNLVTEIFPPFQFEENGKLKGVSVDIVKAIQQKINDNSKIKVYPWNRAYKLTLKKPNYALFSTLRTKERENKFKWIGPLATMKLVFFKNKNSNIKLNSLDDAKKYKIGVTKNVANYDILKGMGFKNLDVLMSGNDNKNIKKLVKNRIDLWPSLRTAGLYNSSKMGYKGKITPIDNVIIFQGDLYIAVNKKTDDKIIQKWQKALDELRKEGVVDKIIRKYEK